MKIAIIGSGISGLTSGYLLNSHHDITLFEKDQRLGGHTATKTVTVAGQQYHIDTGFIVYNDWTYPLFIQLLNRLQVNNQPTTMGFSVFTEGGGFEYSGAGFNGLFAQRKNLLSLTHWQMLKDIIRFNKEAVRDWQNNLIDSRVTLGEYLNTKGYSDAFKNRYLVPMGSAIWSSSNLDMTHFPAHFFIQFFHNHGLLSIKNRPQWRVIQGGSKNYIAPLIKPFADRIRLNDGVISVERDKRGVTVISNSGSHRFDQVIFACHSDQALRLLADATKAETDVLGNMRYQTNTVTLHTDERWLPKNKRAWSSWNYALDSNPNTLPVLTYNMNILQGINSATTFCVTLNQHQGIAQDTILGQFQYAHPVFDLNALQSQQRWSEINGQHHTWFTGAYWHNGFHEDGVRSANRVAKALGGETL